MVGLVKLNIPDCADRSWKSEYLVMCIVYEGILLVKVIPPLRLGSEVLSQGELDNYLGWTKNDLELFKYWPIG